MKLEYWRSLILKFQDLKSQAILQMKVSLTQVILIHGLIFDDCIPNTIPDDLLS